MLRQASQVPANAMVNAADWTAVEKRLKRRKNRIYAVWFFLALISVSSVGVVFHLKNHEISNTPILAETKEYLPTEDINKLIPNFSSKDHADHKNSHKSTNESIVTNSTDFYPDKSLKTIASAAVDNRIKEQTTTGVLTTTNTNDATRAPLIDTQHTPYIPAETITLLPTRNTGSYVGDISLNTLHLIPPTRIASVITHKANTSGSTPPRLERH